MIYLHTSLDSLFKHLTTSIEKQFIHPQSLPTQELSLVSRHWTQELRYARLRISSSCMTTPKSFSSSSPGSFLDALLDHHRVNLASTADHVPLAWSSLQKLSPSSAGRCLAPFLPLFQKVSPALYLASLYVGICDPQSTITSSHNFPLRSFFKVYARGTTF